MTDRPSSIAPVHPWRSLVTYTVDADAGWRPDRTPACDRCGQDALATITKAVDAVAGFDLIHVSIHAGNVAGCGRHPLRTVNLAAVAVCMGGDVIEPPAVVVSYFDRDADGRPVVPDHENGDG